MKNCYFLLVFSFIACLVNAQGKEDYTADMRPSFASSNTKNLVLLIGADPVSKAFESGGREITIGTGGSGGKYYGIQYLYLQNQTVFSGPVSKRTPIEIISSTPNKLVFKLPKIRDNLLEVDLASIHESANQIGVQIATISYQ